MKVYLTEEQVRIIQKGILNETEIPPTKNQEIFERANLILLYDHEQQRDIFFIKNPSKKEMLKIDALKGYKDEGPCTYAIQKHFYFVNLDNLIEVNYDDESASLNDYFYSLSDFLKECYRRLSFDSDDPGCSLSYHACSCDTDLEAHTKAITDLIHNEKSPIIRFFTIDKWDAKDNERREKRIKEIKEATKDYKTFLEKVKSLYHDSFCDCDSSRASMFIDLKKEKKILGPSKEHGSHNIHFVNSFDEYVKEMSKLLKVTRKEHEKRMKELEKKWKNKREI